jgi:tetratricopeptide (TPR) repeat protein
MAGLNLTRGNLEQSIRLYQESSQLYHRLGDREAEAKVLNELGRAFQNAGRLQEAQQSFERALALNKAIGVRSR